MQDNFFVAYVFQVNRNRAESRYHKEQVFRSQPGLLSNSVPQVWTKCFHVLDWARTSSSREKGALHILCKKKPSKRFPMRYFRPVFNMHALFISICKFNFNSVITFTLKRAQVSARTSIKFKIESNSKFWTRNIFQSPLNFYHF